MRIHICRIDRGFGLIDFIVILAVLVVLTGLGAWNLMGAYRQSNEVSLMATTRLIARAQEDFKAQTGAYGTLAELTGNRQSKTALPREFIPTDDSSVLYRGYLLRIFLPGEKIELLDKETVPADQAKGETAETEPQTDGKPRQIPSLPPAPSKSPEATEHWIAYAWPLSYGYTGRRTFVVNENGAVHAADDRALGGQSPEVLTPGLACLEGKPFGAIDSIRWRPIGSR